MITINGQPVVSTRFPDGTSQIWKLDEAWLCRGMTAAVSWRFENEGEVMHLAQLATLLRHYGVRGTLDVRYLPYARQDKPVGNFRTFALYAFAPILNSMGWDEVVLHDPHSSAAQSLIDRATIRGFTDEALAALRATDSDLIVFPDDGARFKYASNFPNLASCFASKSRDQSTGEITSLVISGVVTGKRCLIVDDICDGGATFTRLASALRENGARAVSLFVSHGLFTKGTAVLFDAGIDRIFTPEGEVAR